jgi:protein-disulfide isomerase
MRDTEIVKLKNVISDRDHFAGLRSAPVTLLEYGNFECIDCGHAYPVIKEVQKLLGENLGFVFRHFPSVRTHPHAMRAAEAAEAAGAQDKFWEMHDELFTHQQALEDPDLMRYAKRIGLDVERFGADMAEHTFLKILEADFNRSLFDEHVTGTPTFYINELRYTGAHDFESLLSAIKQADHECRIQWPTLGSGIRGALERLRLRHH